MSWGCRDWQMSEEWKVLSPTGSVSLNCSQSVLYGHVSTVLVPSLDHKMLQFF